MLRNIVIKNTTKDNEKEEEVSKRSSKNSSHEKKNENNFSEDTHMEGNRTITWRKIKQVDHLEGEFKKIKPSTFDGKSRTGEEVEAWILDINKYF